MVDTSTVELKWSEPDVEGLLQYLVQEKQFDEGRVRKAIERLQKCKGKNSQGRLESFFGPSTMHHSSKKKEVPQKGKGKGPLAKKAKR